MAAALPIALVLGSNKKLQRKFLKKVASERNSGGVPVNIVTEVMIYVMGASSKSGRKLAWKRGRVIEFLHSQEIKIADIAPEIKARGGINAVLKQATEESPRRVPKFADTKASGKKSKASVGKISHRKDARTSDEDESHGISARSPVTGRRNDGQVTMGVFINLSDRDTLFELLDETNASLVVKRVDGSGATKIAVVRVKKLKPGVRKPEDDGEW